MALARHRPKAYMTLRRQLFSAIFCIFLIVFVGLLALSVNSTREYLQQQLASHAQDAATSLSYPLAEALAKEDKVLAGIQVSAMFDRGYFQKIVVRSADGSPLIDKELPAHIENVPLWFTQLIPMTTPAGEAFISSGWRQLGKVMVLSQPTFAYTHLWRSVLEISCWILAVFVGSLGLTFWLLRIILRPLEQIEHAALAIGEKRFEQIQVLSKARELKRVVVAMNDMSRRIAAILDAEVARSEKFRREAYVDSVTEMENRRSFDLRFNQLLNHHSEFQHALLMTLELDNLKEFNLEFGYQQGDSMLQEVASAARAILGQHASILSRSGGSAFTFLCLDTAPDLQRPLIDALQSRLIAGLAHGKGAGHISFSLGCTVFHSGAERAHVLARADLAMETARQEGQNGSALILADELEIQSTGSLGWRTMIADALAENRWALLTQAVVALSSGKVVQHEVFSQLIDRQGKPIAASLFLPMALRHHLMASVDRAVITLIIEKLRGGHREQLGHIAVNVASQSISSGEFRSWLGSVLTDLGADARRLSFEVSEFGYARDLEASAAFAALVRSHGAQFGVDHFGLDQQALAAVRRLPPDFLKLNGHLVAEASVDSRSREHLRALVHLASSLEIPITAQNIESEAEVTMLLEDHIYIGQGFHFSAPSALV